MKKADQEEVAIIGVGAIAAHASNASELWSIIINGQDCISEIPTHRWPIDEYYNSNPQEEDQVYAKKGSFIEAIPFDTFEYGIPPANVEVTDTTQLLALIAAKEALQDACQGEYAQVDLQKASVILGVTSAQELLISMAARIQKPMWRKALSKVGLDEQQIEIVCQHIADQYVKWNEDTFPGLLGNVVAGRIANRFNFGGTNCVADAACASSFAALSMAVNELQLHKSDLVITGGADTLNDIFMYMCFAKTHALSFSGKCSPFSEDADGTLLGEAICLFVLKRLTDARKDGDTIYAIIKGIGSSSDGRSKSIYAPLASGQAKAIIRAYEAAGYSPDSVGLMEAHGSGTKAGDIEELKALKEIFSQYSPDKNWCALGSIKSQMGHTKATAGAMGLFKIVMSLSHKILPPTINVVRPNPALELEESPFYLNLKSIPWISTKDQPRRASVNSFGFGGTNFHITVEECQPKEKIHGRLRTLPSELILFSGDSKDEIVRQLTTWENQDPLRLFDLARSTQLNFDAKKNCRLAFIVKPEEELKNKILWAKKQLVEGNSNRDPLFFYSEETTTNNKIAIIFTDVNNHLYMGRLIAMFFNKAREIWDALANLSINQTHLANVVFPPYPFKEEEFIALEKTINSLQWRYIALTAYALSQYYLLTSLGCKATVLMGDAFTNLIALACAGLIDTTALINASLKFPDLAEIKNKILAIDSDTIKRIPTLTSNESLDECLTTKISTQQLAEHLKIQDINLVIEIGNQASLQKSLQLESIEVLSFSSHDENELTEFWQVLAKLSMRGVPLDYQALWQEYVTQQIPLAHQYSPNTLWLNGSNYQKNVSNESVKLKTSISPTSEKNIQNEWHSFKDQLTQWLDQKEKRLENIYCEFEEKITQDQEKWLGQMTQKFEEMINTSLSQKLIASPRIDQTTALPEEKSPPEPITKEVTSPELSPIISIQIDPIPTPSQDSRSVETKEQQPAQMKTEANEELIQKLIQIVAEKTGFDVSIIKPQMSLEADLGIDSIKRVEILAHLRKAYPDLPVGDPNEMADLVTIQEIIHYLQPNKTIDLAEKPTIVHKPVPANREEANKNKIDESTTTMSSVPGKLTEKLIQIIAEKTGFDVSIIKPQMSLKADLGIDSIKRVEILAHLRKAYPDLPVGDPNEMADLTTIHEIIDYLGQKKKY